MRTHSRKVASIIGAVLLVAGTFTTTACGEAEGDAVERFPQLPEASPQAISSNMLGVGFRHGEALRLSLDNAAGLAKVPDVVSHAFLHVKAYDEYAPVYGEYYVYDMPGGVPFRRATEFHGANSARARLEPRGHDLFEEVLDATQTVGDKGFDSISFVVDFWRTRKDWYVRWDGNFTDESNRIGKGNYGFYRKDMSEDLIHDISSLAGTYKPAYVVLGDEMERLFNTEDGEGLSTIEFANFVLFYKQAVEEIRKASPETRVGAGINWDRFVKYVAPLYADDGEVNDAVLDQAFANIILPLAEAGGIVALQSYARAGDEQLKHYQFLRRIPSLYGSDLPIVWYSVGSPIDSPVSYTHQRLFFQDFLKSIAGVNVEAIAWRMLLNFDGSETQDQSVRGRCESLISEERGFLMPKHHCYDGLFTSMFQHKPIFTYFEELVSAQYSLCGINLFRAKFMVLSRTRKIAATLAFVLVYTWMFYAFATDLATDGTAPVARWPMIVLGVCVTFLGSAFVRFKSIWDELGLGGKFARLAGVFVAAVGIVIILFGMTEVPPLQSQGAGLNWWSSFEQAQTYSTQVDKPLMVDFTAEWCIACKELEAEVFNQPHVRELIEEKVIPVKIDFDQASESNTGLLQRLNVTGLPTVVFLSPTGEILREPSFEGKIDVDEFITRLEAAVSGSSLNELMLNSFSDTISETGLVGLLVLVFIAGLLSSLTPCVYPLIPITISVFGASKAQTRWEGFKLSFTYVSGIAVTYAVLGITAASLGTVFGGAMQNPFVIGSIALLFFALGLSSLGVFEFRLPGSLQTKLSQKGGMGYGGALVMGLVAGIIAAPCIGPIVAGILLYVAQQQDVLLGSLLLVTFAFGMGMLFLVLGTFSSFLNHLPRAGTWLQVTKVVFGVVFVAMALYYFRFLMPEINDSLKVVWHHIAA